jgi:hypothetical protein
LGSERGGSSRWQTGHSSSSATGGRGGAMAGWKRRGLVEGPAAEDGPGRSPTSSIDRWRGATPGYRCESCELDTDR